MKSQNIQKEIFTIGRLPDNDLQIADARISSKHCRILRKFDENGKMIVVLEDHSSNGTFLNGIIVSHL